MEHFVRNSNGFNIWQIVLYHLALHVSAYSAYTFVATYVCDAGRHSSVTISHYNLNTFLPIRQHLIEHNPSMGIMEGTRTIKQLFHQLCFVWSILPQIRE